MAYVGSNKMMTSKAYQEVVPEKPENWTHGYAFKSFSFINRDACTVQINGGEPIFLDIEQGFEAHREKPITSFVIVESGIEFQWIGRY